MPPALCSGGRWQIRGIDKEGEGGGGNKGKVNGKMKEGEQEYLETNANNKRTRDKNEQKAD